MSALKHIGNRFLALASVLVISSTAPSAQAAITGCAANYSIDYTFSTGTRWEMCWATDAKKGLVLKQITLTPRNGSRTQILDSAALAQVLVAYDDNSPRSNLLTGTGLPLAPLAAADCPGGSLLQDAGGRPVLCQVVLPRGYAWRGTAQVQGNSLMLVAVSGAGSSTYLQRWTFDDDGSIQPALGVSGALDPARTSTASTGWALGPGDSRYATNRFHTAYWKLDFALGGQADDQFQQLDYSTASDIHNQTVTSVTTESRISIAPDSQRIWRVRDTAITNANGHNISYQIVPNHTALHRSDDAFTSSDVYVTNSRGCEEYASQNAPGGGCGNDLPSYVNGEALSDVVVWMGTTWHQVPRSEDETSMPVHWQGFSLAPRDFSSSSPLL